MVVEEKHKFNQKYSNHCSLNTQKKKKKMKSDQSLILRSAGQSYSDE